MTELEKKSDGLPVESGWDYADAPEAADIVSIDERYGLFVGGEWVEPRSGEWYTTISPATEEPLAEIAQVGPRRREARSRRRARGVRERLVGAPRLRACEVPVPDLARAPGACPRARRARVAERRQADPRVARRRPPARCGALLLLRRLGGQARVRVPEPGSSIARRRGPDHPLELPAAHARVEDRSCARDREHGRAQARRDDAADRAALLRRPPPGRAAAGRRQHRHGRRPDGRGDRQRRRRPRSPSPARPRSARRSSARSPAPASG